MQSNAHLIQYNSLEENAKKICALKENVKKSVNNSVKMKINPKSGNFKRPKSSFANEIKDHHDNNI